MEDLAARGSPLEYWFFRTTVDDLAILVDGAPSQHGFCGGYWGEGPIWSPDGRYLAYRGDGGEAEPDTCDRTVNISDAAGRPVASFPGDGWAIAWSPDSTQVAVWVDFYGTAQLAIYGLDGVRQALLDMPPNGLHQPTSTRCGHRTAPRFWSPVAWRSPSTGPLRRI